MLQEEERDRDKACDASSLCCGASQPDPEQARSAPFLRSGDSYLYKTPQETPESTEESAITATYDPLHSVRTSVPFKSSQRPHPSLSDDQKEFIDLCQSGQLYEDLMRRIGWQGSRRQFKDQVWFRFLYGPNRDTAEYHCPLKPVFQRDFPTVWRYIREAKRQNYAALAWAMQRAESHLIIEVICGRLMEEHPDVPLITIHDSILTTPPHVETVKQVMTEEFAKTGLLPTLKIERYDQLPQSRAA